MIPRYQKQRLGGKNQRGMMLIVLLVIIGLAATTYLIHALDGNAVKIERDRKTAAALAEAKVALIAYAASFNTNMVPCNNPTCRPGDLPCPDTDNDGIAESSCGNAAGTTGQANRLGRLPYKTLGLEDLRDGAGERLWYAVSNNFKLNTRHFPLNSETPGTITVWDSNGNVVANGTDMSGAVAVVFAPGAALSREDGYGQVRDAAGENNPVNYLDVALGEDNSAFVDGGATNGFLTGEIRDTHGHILVNDRLVFITHDEFFAAVEQRVIGEVANALLDYFCGGAVNYAARACSGAGGFYPRPALFSNNDCLGNAAISAPNCPSDAIANTGRLPASPAPVWATGSILMGDDSNNWFQQNAWRELIFYAVAPPCVDGTTNCGGAGGFLTLNHALTLPINNKRVVVISSGRPLAAQARASNTQKTLEANYLEDENLASPDDVFTRTASAGVIFNDRAVSIP
jgi:hypothetical protein